MASARVLTTDATGTTWRAVGKFSLALADSKGTERPAAEVADALALGVLDRLVRVQLTPGPRIKGKATYKIRIVYAGDNFRTSIFPTPNSSR